MGQTTEEATVGGEKNHIWYVGELNRTTITLKNQSNPTWTRFNGYRGPIPTWF